MNRPATHFPVKPVKASRLVTRSVPTVVSVAALAGVSDLVREAFGGRVLERANHAAMIDIETIEDEDCFIPHATMTTFLDAIARQTGEPDLGLMAAPHLSLARYGLWGAYVLGAELLGEAIRRAIATLGYHSRGDRMELRVTEAGAFVGYRNAGRGAPGYVHVASGTLTVLLSLFRPYVPADWRPRGVQLDVPRPASAAAFEDAFACPATFGAPAIGVHFDAALLDHRAIRPAPVRAATLGELARARLEPETLQGFRGVVVAQIWAQVLAGAVSVDTTAQSLGVGARTLQRALHEEGTDFRQLANAIRAQRARELLAGTGWSVTEISEVLGYSAPANFARAFRRASGFSPKGFRRQFGGITTGRSADEV